MIRDASLRGSARRYVVARSLAPHYEFLILNSIDKLIEWLGADPPIGDLTEHVVSEWIRSLESRYAPRTIKNFRAHLISVWSLAADYDLCPAPRVRLIRRVRVDPPQPQAWSVDELRRLVQHAAELPGTLPDGRQRSDYFAGLIRTAYESGLRRSDLFALRTTWITASGNLYLSQLKTRDTHVCRLTEPTIDYIVGLAQHADRPLLWPLSDRTYYEWWRRLCRAASVDNGATHRIRRTGATEIWLEDPERPERVTRYLGHRTAEMRWYYIDRGRGEPPGPEPPKL